MKKVLLNKYKIINLVLLALVLILWFYMSSNYDVWFSKDDDIIYTYRYFDGIYSPLLVCVKWVSAIVAALLIFPSKMFRKWLFYITPVFALLTYSLVSGISVFSTNPLNATRGQMAENCMIAFAMVTAIFVVTHLLYDCKKKK